MYVCMYVQLQLHTSLSHTDNTCHISPYVLGILEAKGSERVHHHPGHIVLHVLVQLHLKEA